jgi:hypothetical protein
LRIALQYRRNASAFSRLFVPRASHALRRIISRGAFALHLPLQGAKRRGDVVVAHEELHMGWCPLYGLAATGAGHGLDRTPGFPGHLGDLPILFLDIGLGWQVTIDALDYGTRYLAVRSLRAVLIKDIEEHKFPYAASPGASSHFPILGSLNSSRTVGASSLGVPTTGPTATWIGSVCRRAAQKGRNRSGWNYFFPPNIRASGRLS